MDEFDRAQQQIERRLDDNLRAHAHRNANARPSANGRCEECDEPIPAARMAVVITPRCAECQQVIESLQKRGL